MNTGTSARQSRNTPPSGEQYGVGDTLESTDTRDVGRTVVVWDVRVDQRLLDAYRAQVEAERTNLDMFLLTKKERIEARRRLLTQYVVKNVATGRKSTLHEKSLREKYRRTAHGELTAGA